MGTPSQSCPLPYILRRQYDERINIKGRLLKERLGKATNLYRKDLLAHFGCVNAIEFSNSGKFLVSGGDDRRVLIWNVDQAVHSFGTPSVMRANHISNIFCLAFDSTTSRVFSAGNDDQVIVHDAATGDPLDFFLHEQPVYGLSIDPLNDYVFASACDDGRILIYDIREAPSTEPFCLARYNSAFHAVMFNPVESRLLTTANSKEGVGLWDVRKPCQVLMRFGGSHPSQSCMSVRFNQAGNKILALRRRLPPVLYSVRSSLHICQFDHPGYYNSCTMKSCSFAGDDDQYILSGSDDFNLYMWKIPKTDDEGQWVGSAHMILHGHRSIVNQVRFHPTNCLIASSGVEKLIKFWSPYPLPNSVGSLVEGQKYGGKQRRVFTHEEYISLVLRTGQFMTHDYSHQSTKEDPRMMAFFDSLVQREIEGWISEEVLSSDIDTNAYAVASSQSDSEPAYAATGDTVDPIESEPEEAQNRITQLIARKRVQLLRHAKSLNREDAVPVKKNSRPPGRYMNSFRKPPAGFVSDTSDSEPEVASKRLCAATSDETFRKKCLRSIGPRKNGNLFSNEKYKMPVSKLKTKKELKHSCDIRKHRLKYMIAYSDSSDENNDNINVDKDDNVGDSDDSGDNSTEEYKVADDDVRKEEVDEDEEENYGERWRSFRSRRKLWKKTVKCPKKSSTLGINSCESSSKKTDDVPAIEASTSSMHHTETSSNQAKRFCRKRRKMFAGKRQKINLNVLETSSSDDAEASKLGMVVRTYECKSKASKNKNLELDCKENLIEHNNNNDDNFDSNAESKQEEKSGSSVPELVQNTRKKVPTSSNGALITVAVSHQENSDESSKSDVFNGNTSKSSSINVDNSVTCIQTSVITSAYSTPNGKQSNHSLEDYKTPDSGIVLKECTSTGSGNSVVGVSCQPSCSSNYSLPLQDSSPNGGNRNENWTVFKKFRIKNRERIRRNFRNHHDDSESP